MIDLEALILATTRLGIHEPRLFNECLDWLSRFGSFVHLQRLKTLQAETKLADPAILSAMAAWLVEKGGQPKWKAHVSHGPAKESIGALSSGEGETAPLVARQGVFRTPVRIRGMSKAPNPTLAPNLLLSLRALIGVSARAEVILCLSSRPAANPSEIARLTGYKARTMQLLLQEMLLSGQVFASELPDRKKTAGRGRSRRYHMKEHDWRFLTGGQPLPQWTVWPPLWSLVCTVVEALPVSGEPEKHQAVVSSKIREKLAADGEALAAAGFLPALDVRPGAPGAELLDTLEVSLPQLLGEL
ncbi:MAG: hypothetical protein KF712_15165 [Akkermansiaceae bacterium]|nr:hypothetical protein [Akkermansiaceae bacterium]